MCVLVAAQQSFGMQKAAEQVESKQAVATGMTKIESVEQAKQFAGKIVAFQGGNSYFTFHGFNQTNSDTKIFYGYVENKLSGYFSPRNEQGYKFISFIKQGSVHSGYVLLNSTIEKGSLWMRSVTIEDIKVMIHAVEAREAEFAYGNREANDLLLAAYQATLAKAGQGEAESKEA